jgi:ABC-type dipeptide/oligopeptide/nickel transport system permease component
VIGYLLRRVGHAAATWLVAVTLIFLAMRVLPGNPLLSRFGQHPDAAQIAQLRQANGWDRPLLLQLGEFFYKLFTTGDLGESIARGGTSVSHELAERIPATVELTLAALLLALPLGIGAGVIAAQARGRWPDWFFSTLSLVGVSIPIFFLGMLLREVFTSLPISQRLPVEEFAFEPITGLYLIDVVLRGRLDLFGPVIAHLLLPAVTLSTVPAASIAKITRGAMLDALHADYVRTAGAKGAPWWRIVWRHALPNAAVPVANISGLQIGLLLTGAVLTETVFDWPGIGKYLADAVVNDKDYAVVQAGAIVIAALFALLNLLLDLVYMWLDPRIRPDTSRSLA